MVVEAPNTTGSPVSPVQAATAEPTPTVTPKSALVAANGELRTRERGSKAVIKKFQENWNSKLGRYEVVDTVSMTAELSEHDEYAFVVRTRIAKEDNQLTTYIDVNSQIIRDILRNVMHDVKMVNLRKTVPTVEERLLYVMLPELRSYRADTLENPQPNQKALQHLDLLIQHVEQALAMTTDALSLRDHGEITFDLLWALFRPNQLVYTECVGTGRPRCFKLESAEMVKVMGETRFRIEGRHFDFDGKNFGESSLQVEIDKFSGVRRIDSHRAYPLDLHSRVDELKLELTACGRKMIQLMGTHHRHYRGLAFIVVKGKPLKLHVDSRIMVDAEFFRENNPNYTSQKVEQPCIIDLSHAFYDDTWDNNEIREYRDPSQLGDADLMRCNPNILGFSFDDKKWLEFAVVDVYDVVWQPSILESLAMPEGQKNIILSLAEARGNFDNLPFDDVIPGKGRGLNVLLYGPPGTGKTLTAEAVAEHLQRPLYPILTAELGIRAADLEECLTRVFRLARRWHAVLLLDEADTYMEKRTSQDLYRNGLVSVFLRNLEYCGSVLFLTTNRVIDFDDAILSRIHVMTAITTMNRETRETVWLQFLQRAATHWGAASVGRKELRQLSEEKLNARQIKNAVATAHALASRERCSVSYSHLEVAVEQIKTFFHDIAGAAQGLYN